MRTPTLIAVLSFGSGFPLLAEPVAGLWEQFASQEAADDWALYSYDDELVAPPLWAGPEIDENPYAYSNFLGGEGVWFFADTVTAGGRFTGDYAAERIAAIDVSVFIDPAQLDFLDVAVYADGPAGENYYYSRIRTPEELEGDEDWYALSFPFDTDWFYLENGDFIPFRPGEGLLASIGEVGVRVFPVDNVAEDASVGIDDFILAPDEDPGLVTETGGGEFLMEFTVNPGVKGSVERWDGTMPMTWETVPGEEDLAGMREFSTPLDSAREFFRVRTDEVLTPVADVGGTAGAGDDPAVR